MRRALLFTEWGETIGLGHLRRSEALRDHLLASGFEAKIYANLDPRDHKDWREGDWGVIDSYLLPLEAYEWVSHQTQKAIFLDDTLRLDYPKGVILNGAMGAQNLAYPPKEGRELWLGGDYTLVRQEFWNLSPKPIAKKPQRLLITLGGSVQGLKLQQEIEAWASAHFPHLERLTLNPHLSPSAREIRSIMQKADIAISGAGGTLNECAACGLPVIAIQIAPNQCTLLEGWSELGAMERVTLGDWEALGQALERLHSPFVRQDLSLKAWQMMQKTRWKEILK